jgi:hypothetical protein
MIERFLYTTLKDGIQAMLDDLAILDDLFVDLYELEQSEVDKIKEVFTEDPPGVIHSYARTETSIPVFSIVLESENESEHFLGDDAGMIDDPEDPDFGADCKSTIWDHKYQILCYTEHPDLTLYYYEMAKSIFLTADLSSYGLFMTHLSGADLMPDPRYIPEHLFVRRLSFECSREFLRLDRGSKLGKAFRVRGIHVDKSGSPSDVGGVKTLVDPTSILAEES